MTPRAKHLATFIPAPDLSIKKIFATKKAAPTPAPYTYLGALFYITSIKYAKTTIKLAIASNTISLKGLN